MSVAFVLTCLLGMNQAQLSPTEVRCGQAFATQAECSIIARSMRESASSTFMLPKGVQSPVQEPEHWCAPRTVLRIEAGELTITKNGVSEVLSYREPFGMGLNGHVYMGPTSLKRDVVLQAKVLMDSREGQSWEPEIRIFRNQVFWPCNRGKKDQAVSSGVTTQ